MQDMSCTPLSSVTSFKLCLSAVMWCFQSFFFSKYIFERDLSEKQFSELTDQRDKQWDEFAFMQIWVFILCRLITLNRPFHTGSLL